MLQCRVVSSLQHSHFVSRIISILKTHEKCPPCGAVDSHTRGICGHAQPPKIGFNVRSLPGDHFFRVAFWLLGENGMILHVCRIPAFREVIRKTRELFGHIDQMGYETEMTNYGLKVGIFWVIFSKTKNWVKIFTNRFVYAALINPSFFFFWRLLL